MKIAFILKMHPALSMSVLQKDMLELERQSVDLRIYLLEEGRNDRFFPDMAGSRVELVHIPQLSHDGPKWMQAADEMVRSVYPDRAAVVRRHAWEHRKWAWLQPAAIIAAHLLQYPVYALHACSAFHAGGISRYVYQLTAVPYSCAIQVTDLELAREIRPQLREILRAARFAIAGSRAEQAYCQQLMAGAGVDIRCLERMVSPDLVNPDEETGPAAAPGTAMQPAELFERGRKMATFRRWLAEPIVETAVFPAAFNPRDVIIDSPYSPLSDSDQ